MPFPYDKYPWVNFHELNLAYFIEHFREIFQQWDELYTGMLEWKADTEEELETWKNGVMDAIDNWEHDFSASIQVWQQETETDLENWKITTLAALDAWKTAAEAVFESIRVQAAGSASAAAQSAADAETARAAAATAQAAAEAAAAGVSASLAQIQTNTDDIAILRGDLDPTIKNLQAYAGMNLADYFRRVDRATADITFTFNADGSCTVQGTSGATRFCNLYDSSDEIPAWIVKGKSYSLTYSSSNVRFRIYIYENGVLNGNPILDTLVSADFTIPATASGVLFRLHVSPNKTVNETVNPAIYDGISTAALEQLIENLSQELGDHMLLAMESHGLFTGSLADIDFNGWVVTTVESTTDLPGDDSVYLIGTMFSNTNHRTGTQIGISTTNGRVFIRRKQAGTWGSWITFNAYRVAGRYVAFGDSVTEGSVWDYDQSTQYTIADPKYQIPTRIAVATGMDHNFKNEAVGGTGYYNRSSAGASVTEKILAYNYANVSLVTVMAGVNDKDDSTHPLGTADTPTTGTICGAIKSIIDFFNANHPRIQLVIIQPTPSGHLNNPYTGTLAAGWSLDDFDDEVSKLCHANHVGYCSWRDCTMVKNWDSFSGGYSRNPGTGVVSGPNYSHMATESDYAILGNYIAGKVSEFYVSSN